MSLQKTRNAPGALYPAIFSLPSGWSLKKFAIWLSENREAGVSDHAKKITRKKKSFTRRRPTQGLQGLDSNYKG